MIVDADDGKNKKILVETLSDIKYQILIVDANDGKNKEILVVTLSDIKYQILIVDADDEKKIKKYWWSRYQSRRSGSIADITGASATYTQHDTNTKATHNATQQQDNTQNTKQSNTQKKQQKNMNATTHRTQHHAKGDLTTAHTTTRHELCNFRLTTDSYLRD